MQWWIQGGAVVLLTMTATGCATLIPLALDPAGTANRAVNDSVNQITHPDPGLGSTTSVNDLDRIISEHPDAENVSSLRDLRQQMVAQASTPAKRSADDDPKRDYAGQHDRRQKTAFFRHTPDKVHLDTAGQFKQPYGLRNTPRSHPSNETLPATLPTTQALDFSQVRFSGK